MTLPEGWALADLAELSTKIGSGATPRGGKEVYHKIGTPLIRSMNVHFDGFKRDGLAFIDDLQAKALDNVTVSAGDVLLNITGASIGRVCLAPEDMSGARVNQHVCIIRTVSYLLAVYIQRLLAAPAMQRYIVEENYGFTRQALTKDMIEKLVVPLPPLDEQRRIVTKLDALTTRLARARDDLSRVATLAEKLREEILSAVRHETSVYEPVSVGDLSITSFDGPFGSNLKSADYTTEGVRVIRLENIGHLKFRGDKETFISKEKFSGLTRHRLIANDILFSSFVDEEVRVCRFPGGDGLEAINKADCFVIRPDTSRCSAEFLTYMLAAPATYEKIKSDVHGDTRPRIGLSHLRSFSVYLPPLEKQNEFVTRIDAAFARADRLQAVTARGTMLLGRLESAILAKAFRGELVPQDPTDEPASVLLERIRAQRFSVPSKRRQSIRDYASV